LALGKDPARAKLFNHSHLAERPGLARRLG